MGNSHCLPASWEIRHDGSVSVGFIRGRGGIELFLCTYSQAPRRIFDGHALPLVVPLPFQTRRTGARAFTVFINTPVIPMFIYFPPPPSPSPLSRRLYYTAPTFRPIPPPLFVVELRFNLPSKGPEITDLPPPESMLSQWSTSHCLGDHPARSGQHECRFPPIIQLDEVAPPPPPQKSSLSPVPSSSQSYDYWSSSSEEFDEVEDGEEEEEATESYCSSDPSCPGFGMGDSDRGSTTASAPVEQKVKMNRVLAWRSSFDSVFVEDNAGMFSHTLLCHPLGTFFLPLATIPCPTN